VWQIIAHQTSGVRVKCEIRFGYIVSGLFFGTPVGKDLAKSAGNKPFSDDEPGHRPAIALYVSNVGRLPAVVTQVMFAVLPVEDVGGRAPCPIFTPDTTMSKWKSGYATIDVSSVEMCFFDAWPVINATAALEAAGASCIRGQMVVTLGNGVRHDMVIPDLRLAISQNQSTREAHLAIPVVRS